MPYRDTTFLNNNIYHVFNKTIDGRRIFNVENNCINFLNVAAYYRSSKSKLSYSYLSQVNTKLLNKIQREITYRKHWRVEIICYCLMPTHFHFLIKQKTDGGIQKFISNLINSFTKFSNLKLERYGPLLMPRFKSNLILTEEQFTHSSRYMHLNPYSSGLVKNIDDLENYLWSSYPSYAGNKEDVLVSHEDLLSLFNYDKSRYREFVTSNADWQKTLEKIKYQEKWL